LVVCPVFSLEKIYTFTGKQLTCIAMTKRLHNTHLLIAAVVLFSFVHCSAPVTNITDEEYIKSISQWDSMRLANLKSADGWLNLAGLYWLQEGENTLGSDPGNQLVFPRGPGKIGSLFLENETIRFTASENIEVFVNNEAVKQTELVSDKEGRPSKLTVDSLGFFIIKRGLRTGVRLRDYLNPRIDALQAIDRFPPDKNWIIQAKFIRNTEGLTIAIPDVLGDVTVDTIPGILEFEFEKSTYRLYPTGSEKRMFLVFGDDTNALETYGAGRFLSIDGPDSLGLVNIDFNKAYNPPCAFSEFATCPLPPKENMLPFKVLAGEKSVPH
jgi:uncharacterized protein